MLINCYFNKSCNWNCYYCSQGDKTKYKTKSDDQLLQSFKSTVEIAKYFCDVNENLYIGAIGGEPGLWSEYLWEGILSIVKEYEIYLQIFTNGTAFDHPSLQEENEKIEYIWHCSLDLDPVKIPDIKKNILYYEIVITRSNLSKLDAYLTLNNHITFKIDAVQSSYYKKNDLFTIEEWDILAKILSKHANVEKFSFNSILALKNRLKNDDIKTLQSYCQKQKTLSLIDLSEDSIYRCCESTDQLPLNEENLQAHLNRTLFKEANCGSCINHIFYYLEKTRCQTLN